MRWQNYRNATLYDISFSEKVKRVLFHPLSSRFLKESHFWGGSSVGFFGFFGPKGAFGSQKHVEEISGVSEEIWRFLKKFCESTLSNLLSVTQTFSNPTTRWRCQTPVSWLVCWFHHWQLISFRLYEQKRHFYQSWFVLSSINTLKKICQRMTSLLNACFPVLWCRGLKSHSFDCSTCLRSTCIQAGW